MQDNLDSLKMDVMDISWALISNWRDMLIQIFDTPEKIKDLQDVKSVIIKYNCNTTDTMLHPEIRALYLQAWLACCLGWEYHHTEKHENNTVISYIGALHPAIVALMPQKMHDLPPGGISDLEITTTGGSSYSVARKQDISRLSCI